MLQALSQNEVVRGNCVFPFKCAIDEVRICESSTEALPWLQDR